MNYNLEFERAKFHIIINECDDIDELKSITNKLLDAYFDYRIIGQKMIGDLLLKAPLGVNPESV